MLPSKSKPVTNSIVLHKTKAAKNNSAAAIPIQTAIKSNGTGAKNTAKQKADLPAKLGKRKYSKTDIMQFGVVNHSV